MGVISEVSDRPGDRQISGEQTVSDRGVYGRIGSNRLGRDRARVDWRAGVQGCVCAGVLAQ